MRFYFTTFVIAVFAVIAVTGCVQQPQPITNITIDGVDYSFTNDVREALKVPVNDRFQIQQLMIYSKNISVIFDCSIPEEKPSIAVAAHNAVSTIQNYLVSHGTFARFPVYCFVGEQWYDATDNSTAKPVLGTTLWFKGPKTGANETSVLAENNTIVIQGTDYKNLTLATDAFSLTVLGVSRI